MPRRALAGPQSLALSRQALLEFWRVQTHQGPFSPRTVLPGEREEGGAAHLCRASRAHQEQHEGQEELKLRGSQEAQGRVSMCPDITGGSE